jgi:hypothetical protein
MADEELAEGEEQSEQEMATALYRQQQEARYKLLQAQVASQKKAAVTSAAKSFLKKYIWQILLAALPEILTVLFWVAIVVIVLFIVAIVIYCVQGFPEAIKCLSTYGLTVLSPLADIIKGIMKL